jgi:hypothetical protein
MPDLGLRPAKLTIEKHWLEYPNGIPIESWGKDHHSTLLYAESCAVDQAGKLRAVDRRMRMDANYPTRLGNSVQVIGHTDYDCLADAQAAGLLTWNEDEEIVRFTDEGWAYVHGLRRKRAEAALAKESKS